MEVYDSIVVGGGIVGSFAAYSLTQKAKKVLVIDQFAVPHTRGSSHGPVRHLLVAHFDHVFAKMALDSFPSWETVGKLSGTSLLRKTGSVVIDKPPYKYLGDHVTLAEQLGIPHSVLSLDDIAKKYPGLINLPADRRVYYEEDAGVVRSDKALSCLREIIAKSGGRFREEEKVLAITPGELITVRTNKGTYRTTGLVLAPGSWASQLLEPLGVHLPLRVKRAIVCYWKEPIPGQTTDYPVFVDGSFEPPAGGVASSEPFFGYGFPASEYPGLRKISIHHGAEIDPDHRDAAPGDEETMGVIRSYMKARFPELGQDPRPSIIESCIYTDSADGGIIIDTVPQHGNIVYCCGLSGTGFRVAPMVGRVLAEMVSGKPTSYDLSSFRSSRFPPKLLQSKY